LGEKNRRYDLVRSKDVSSGTRGEAKAVPGYLRLILCRLVMKAEREREYNDPRCEIVGILKKGKEGEGEVLPRPGVLRRRRRLGGGGYNEWKELP